MTTLSHLTVNANERLHALNSINKLSYDLNDEELNAIRMLNDWQNSKRNRNDDIFDININTLNKSETKVQTWIFGLFKNDNNIGNKYLKLLFKNEIKSMKSVCNYLNKTKLDEIGIINIDHQIIIINDLPNHMNLTDEEREIYNIIIKTFSKRDRDLPKMYGFEYFQYLLYQRYDTKSILSKLNENGLIKSKINIQNEAHVKLLLAAFAEMAK